MISPRNLRSPACWAILVAISAALGFLLNASERERMLAANTAYLVGWVLTFSLPVGVTLAVLLWRTNLPWRRFFVLLLVVMMLMPLYLQTTAWRAGFGELGWFTLADGQPLGNALIDRWQGAIWIHTWAAIPWATVIVGIGLRHVPSQLEESARLHASAPLVLWRVTLPQSAGFIAAAALWVVVTVAGEITVTDMWQLRTYAEEVFIGFAVGDTLEEVQLGVLPGAMLIAGLTMAAGLLSLPLTSGDSPTQSHQIWQVNLGRARWAWFAAVMLVFFVMIDLPLLNLLLMLGHQVDQGERTWSIAQALSTLAGSFWEFRTEIWWSVVLGSLTAILTLTLATPLAYVARGGGWATLPALAISAICLGTPGPLVGLGLAAVLNAPRWALLNWIYDSPLAPAIAQTIRALPLVTFLLWYAFRSLPRAPLEAARLQGLNFWQTLLRVALPQRWAAMLAAGLLALAVSLGELSASFLVYPPGVEPLSVRIFQLAHYGVESRLASIALVTTTVAAIVALAATLAFTRNVRV